LSEVTENVYITVSFLNVDSGETRAETMKLRTFTETDEGAIIEGTETESGSKVTVTFEYEESE
jgi:hypothetical protein